MKERSREVAPKRSIRGTSPCPRARDRAALHLTRHTHDLGMTLLKSYGLEVRRRAEKQKQKAVPCSKGIGPWSRRQIGASLKRFNRSYTFFKPISATFILRPGDEICISWNQSQPQPLEEPADARRLWHVPRLSRCPGMGEIRFP